MGEHTKIQWCDHTFNCWRGCTRISKGCQHCYAETMSHRNPKVLGEWGPTGQRVIAGQSYWHLPIRWDRAAARAGERRRVFCLSLGDIWEDRPELTEPRLMVLETIRRTPNLDWLLLTKRPENAFPLIRQAIASIPGNNSDWDSTIVWASEWLCGKAPANVWMGASVEDEETTVYRTRELLRIPAVVRFLSIEPLLAPISPMALNLWRVAVPKHEDHWPAERVRNFWVILGGESGDKARPCDLQWFREIIAQCRDNGLPIFVKQLGSNVIDTKGNYLLRDVVFPKFSSKKADVVSEWPVEFQIREMPEPRA